LNRNGNRKYASFSFYLIGVVELCEAIVVPTIEAHLSALCLLDKAPNAEEWHAESLELIEQSNVIPDWVKKMSCDNPFPMDYQTIHQASMVKLRELLKPIPLVPQGA
jgi:hypothetical protein